MGVIYSLELDKKTLQWIRDTIYEKHGLVVAKMVDDKISWILYDEEGKVIFRLPKTLVDRIMEMVFEKERRVSHTVRPPKEERDELNVTYDEDQKDDWS